MADDAGALTATGTGDANTPLSPASETLGDVDISLLGPLERVAGAGDAQATTTMLAAGPMSDPKASRTIKTLLATGVDVKATGGRGQTALPLALSSDQHPGPAIRALKFGEPIHTCRTPLDSLRLSIRAVKLLLAVGANNGIAATGRDPELLQRGQRKMVTTVPADNVGAWADQMPTLTKTKRESQSATIRPMLARAEFVRKDWLSVLQASCFSGSSISDVCGGNGGRPMAHRKTTPGVEPSSAAAAAKAAAAETGENCASGGEGVADVHGGVCYGACIWIAMAPDDAIFRNVVDWL
eukprot:g10185.t1